HDADSLQKLQDSAASDKLEELFYHMLTRGWRTTVGRAAEICNVDALLVHNDIFIVDWPEDSAAVVTIADDKRSIAEFSACMYLGKKLHKAATNQHVTGETSLFATKMKIVSELVHLQVQLALPVLAPLIRVLASNDGSSSKREESVAVQTP